MLKRRLQGKIVWLEETARRAYDSGRFAYSPPDSKKEKNEAAENNHPKRRCRTHHCALSFCCCATADRSFLRRANWLSGRQCEFRESRHVGAGQRRHDPRN